GRDDQKWLTRAVAAPAKSVLVGRINARQGSCAIAASSGPSQCICASVRGVNDRSNLMIVPTIGVVIEDHDCCAAPGRLPLKEIDQIHDEGLFVQRIGITGVAVLVGGCLNEVDGRKVAGRYSSEEVIDIVL